MNLKEAGLTHINKPMANVLKEVVRRAGLRPRLEAEFGRALSDEEFLVIAERTGIKI